MMTTDVEIVAVAGVLLLGLVASQAFAERRWSRFGEDDDDPEGRRRVFVGSHLLGNNQSSITSTYTSSGGRRPRN